MSLYSFYRISKPSEAKVPEDRVDGTYKSLRNRTFWGATMAYSLYYVCRMSLSVIKQPLIDEGVLTAGQLGLVGSALLFVYALGKFLNGFIADYCNIRRFMATGLILSSVANLLMGVLGLLHGSYGLPQVAILLSFAFLWGMNGWMQSMGAPPGVISLSRWFPQSKRGTWYGIFSASPYLGETLSFIATAAVVSAFGWQYGFISAAVAGFVGFGSHSFCLCLILLRAADFRQCRNFPENHLPKRTRCRQKELQKLILRHPGIVVIAVSSAFIYITKYAVAGWGVLFLQKAGGFSLEDASRVIAFSAAFGVLGTVLAGWLSDTVFRGDRVKPAIVSGILGTLSLGLFLFAGGGFFLNIFYVSLFSLSTGVLYCIVAGLMAVDIVPRKATGAALGIVGISSYVAAGLQDITSGYLIQGFMGPDGTDMYDFGPVSWFWMAASVVSFALPVMNWKKMKHKHESA